VKKLTVLSSPKRQPVRLPMVPCLILIGWRPNHLGMTAYAFKDADL
jgi:hypothetical protein